jgi:primosomal protein N'
VLTASENKVLLNERQKYLSHINKHFKQMLPNELTSKKAMKEKADELGRRLKEEKLKREEQESLRANKRKRAPKEPTKGEAPLKGEAPSKKVKRSETSNQKNQSGKAVPKTTNKDPIANIPEIEQQRSNEGGQ